MECVIVSSEDECEAQVKAHKERGLRLACVSNTGLPPGQARLTFLPPEAFTSPSPQSPSELSSPLSKEMK